MITATADELQSQCASLLTRVRAGEEILITESGQPIARLVPEKAAEPKLVNWAEAPEITRDRSKERMLTAQESLDIVHEASGKW